MPSLMETLDATAFGQEPYEIKPVEINLILSAERWLLEHHWEEHYIRGWTNVGRSFGPGPAGGLMIRERRRGFWDAEGQKHPVRSVVAGLNVLVNEEILPAQFSTLGMKALADFAEAAERAAVRLEEAAEDLPRGLSYTQDRVALLERARGTRIAADVARGHDPIGVFA